MNPRLAKLIRVRRIESRQASAVFAEAAVHALQQMSVADRLKAAERGLSLEPTQIAGQSLAAQLELAGRVRAARQVALDRTNAASAERDDAALMRKRAVRALDAAVDIHRAADRALVRRKAVKQAPAHGGTKP